MDTELLVALMVLWLSTTSGIFFFFRMFFAKGGEAFHPHSVDVDHRHDVFLAVNSRTMCKMDCPVKSISTFVAPRGSSSSKQFTVLSCMIAVAGFLGTSRWYALGGVNIVSAVLCFAGFASLLLVAAFELDVVPDRYLEDKLTVTGWLIERLEDEYKLKAPFSTSNIYHATFREFIRSSKDLHYLYEEDIYLINRSKKLQPWIYQSFWPILHMIGACAYVTLVPAAIILHDDTEYKVAFITGAMFFFFCGLSYLSGNFFPVFKSIRCMVLMWNPFLREPYFMLKLKMALEAFIALKASKNGHGDSEHKTKKGKKSKTKKRSNSNSSSSLSSQGGQSNKSLTNCDGSDSMKDPFTPTGNHLKQSVATLNPLYTAAFVEEAHAVDRAILTNPFLRFAREHPRGYIRILGHIAVLSELIAMMTPSIALGLQWVTALCDGPSLYAVIDLLVMVFTCLRSGQCSFSPDRFQHCILKT